MWILLPDMSPVSPEKKKIGIINSTSRLFVKAIAEMFVSNVAKNNISNYFGNFICAAQQQQRETSRCLTQEVKFSQTYLLGQLPPRWGIWDVDWLSGTECRHCVLHRNSGRLWRDTSTQHTAIRTSAVQTATTGGRVSDRALSTHRSSSWARCQPTQCGRWCPPPRSGSARYCGSQCRDSQTPAPAPDPTAQPQGKQGQKVRKVIAMATKKKRWEPAGGWCSTLGFS